MAATGGLAFTDADCAPEKQWLKELLKGIESDDIGCFVGDVAPQPFVGMVDEYVHDRMVINPEKLLRSSPPVVATGNVAYRNTVFETIGLFDASFKSGGDGEFSWRMQKCSDFRIRYNPKAIVFHRHPSSLNHLLRRSHFIGIGIAQFRLKHAEDFPKEMRSIIYYKKVIFITALGLLKYPFLVATNLKKGMLFKKSLVYPILNKLCALTYEAGILNGLKQRKNFEKPCISKLKQKGWANIFLFRGSRDVVGGSFDQIFFDLDNASLFLKDEPELTALVRVELKTISQCLLKIIPDATILLTGSFSVGEGKYNWANEKKVIQSDYDIVVVIPSLVHTMPYFVTKKLDAFRKKVCLSTDLEITLIWKPLLELHLTTTGGKIIAGRRDLCKIIEKFPPPRAANAIIMAYRFLAGAPLDSSEYSILLSKALMRAAQAILLQRYKKSPRKEWIQLSSIRSCQDRIEKFSEVIGKEGVDAIQRAGDELLGKRDAGWDKKDFTLAKELLQVIQTIVFPSPCWQDLSKHASWLYFKRILGLPSLCTGAYCLKGLQLLTEAWKNGDRLQKETVAKASCVVSRFCFGAGGRTKEDPLEIYRRLYNLLSDYVVFYPNKLYFPRKTLFARNTWPEFDNDKA